MQPKVSIVGAGPAGFALAVDLESRGTSALVYSHPSHLQHAHHVVSNGGLRANGAMKASASPRITLDMGEAVEHSKIIVLAVPSSGQETILRELRRFRLDQHTIVAIPGNLFSLVVGCLDMKVGCIVETNLSPYSSRMSDGELVVLGKKSRLFVAAQREGGRGGGSEGGPPGSLAKTLPLLLHDEDMRIVFPTIELKWCYNVLEVCLSNVNGVFHPPMMLMNAGRIESTSGDFLFYRDGLTRSVASTISAIDRVRLKIGEVLGFRLRSALEVSNECYGQDFADLVDLARRSAPHNRLRAPSGLDNRNLSEDVADLLVCWHGLAERLGVDASPLRAIIVLVEMATDVDYMKAGRNLEKLGLDGISRAELVERFGAPRSSSGRRGLCRC